MKAFWTTRLGDVGFAVGQSVAAGDDPESPGPDGFGLVSGPDDFVGLLERVDRCIGRMAGRLFLVLFPDAPAVRARCVVEALRQPEADRLRRHRRAELDPAPEVSWSKAHPGNHAQEL